MSGLENLFERYPCLYRSNARGVSIEEQPYAAILVSLEKYGFPTDNFKRNLKTLLIKEDKSVGNEVELGYHNPRLNIISYSTKIVIKHELIHCASSAIDPDTGMGKRTSGISTSVETGQVYKKVGDGLNEGITEFFTFLFDTREWDKKIEAELTTEEKEICFGYPFESFCVKEIFKAYGPKVFNPYFDNDRESFFKQFGPEMKMLSRSLDNYQKALAHVAAYMSANMSVPREYLTRLQSDYQKTAILLGKVCEKGNLSKKELDQDFIYAQQFTDLALIKFIMAGSGGKGL